MSDHVKLDDKKPRKFFITRNASYAKNSAKARGYFGNYHNVHHVVPCTSVQTSVTKYLEKKPYHYNKALARFTDWDVNNDYNLIGLAYSHAYSLAYKETSRRALNLLKPGWKMASVANPGLVKFPVHLPTSWGHVSYNSKVSKRLDAVWRRLNGNVKKHEPTSAPDLGQSIKNIGTIFEGQLLGKVGQTKAAWKKNRYSAQFMMA